MYFGQSTPEALIPRSDSRNPATTCRGITSNGRPCRRAIAAASPSRHASGPVSGQQYTNGSAHGVISATNTIQPFSTLLDEESAAELFCWQHRDQAENLLAAQRDQLARIALEKAREDLTTHGKSKNGSGSNRIREKSSIDTLVDRVGLMNLDSESVVSNRHMDGVQRHQRTNLPTVQERVEHPRRGDHKPQQGYAPGSRKPARKHSQTQRSSVKSLWPCCFGLDVIDEKDHEPAVQRREKRNELAPHDQLYNDNQQNDTSYSAGSRPQNRDRGQTPRLSPSRYDHAYNQQQPHFKAANLQTSHHASSLMPTRDPHPTRQQISPMNNQSPSQINLSLIPPTASPRIAALLLAELSKPISRADEAGYIYIFWLTPESEPSKPDDETASTILDPDNEFGFPTTKHAAHNLSSSSWNRHQLNPSIPPPPPASRLQKSVAADQALYRYSSVRRPRQHGSRYHHPMYPATQNSAKTRPPPPAPPPVSEHQPQSPSKRTILLKIGRANNVHRRLTQWTKQCGQNLTLIRYYPQISTNPQISGRLKDAADVFKVPHVHRVERLIHIELSERRVRNVKKFKTLNNEDDEVGSGDSSVPEENDDHDEDDEDDDDDDDEDDEDEDEDQDADREYMTSNKRRQTLKETKRSHKQKQKEKQKQTGKKADAAKCPNCGREHREWFEVDASRSGLRYVDSVVKRWVEWGMRYS